MDADRSIVKHDAHERAVDLEAAVVFDEAELTELVHEEVHPRPRGADHFGEHFLRELRQDALWRVLLSIACQKEQRPGETLLARIEQMVDEILLDADVS